MNKSILETIINNPELCDEVTHGLVEQYKPIVDVILKEFLVIVKEYSEYDDIYKIKSTMKKKQVDAYINDGFTREEAVAFIINDNLRLIDNMKKVSYKGGK